MVVTAVKPVIISEKRGTKMKRLHIKTQFGYCILNFALCILLVLLSACGSDTGTSVNTSSDTGSIAFSIVWEGGPEISSSQKAVTKEIKKATTIPHPE